jgi:hypothetical protein
MRMKQTTFKHGKEGEVRKLRLRTGRKRDRSGLRLEEVRVSKEQEVKERSQDLTRQEKKK